MPTVYNDITMYLDAIAGNANGIMAKAPHQYWWHQDPTNPSSAVLTYKDFTTGNVYGVVDDQGKPVPIINQATPLQSTFYILLTTKGGNGTFPQMPKGGPFLTDANFGTLTLSNGDVVSGAQMAANLATWLGNKYPENC